MPTIHSRNLALWGLLTLLILSFIFSLFLGRYPEPGLISPQRIIQDTLAQQLVFNLRLPRIISAVLLGMVLSTAGTIFQMIFGNPLVEPGFLGVSQGAAFGTAFGIIFLGNAAWLIQVTAAIFALSGLALSYFVARRIHFGGWVLRLVLSGIVISALFSAGLGILKYLADPLSQLPEITFWLLGGLWGITWERLSSISIIVVLSLIFLFLMRWRINLLSLNDETSHSLGITPGKERSLLLLVATIATAAVISVSGMVGWVGLIIPHIARRLFGADARYSLPAAMLIGGLFSLFCDDLARVILPGEIPLGILTAFLGATIFLILMIRQTLSIPK
ncbi:MAG: iron ABC transporter permease [Chloroflexota bacterium]